MSSHSVARVAFALAARLGARSHPRDSTGPERSQRVRPRVRGGGAQPGCERGSLNALVCGGADGQDDGAARRRTTSAAKSSDQVAMNASFAGPHHAASSTNDMATALMTPSSPSRRPWSTTARRRASGSSMPLPNRSTASRSKSDMKRCTSSHHPDVKCKTRCACRTQGGRWVFRSPRGHGSPWRQARRHTRPTYRSGTLAFRASRPDLPHDRSVYSCRDALAVRTETALA